LKDGELSVISFADAHISGVPCETKNEENLMLANCDMTIGDFAVQFQAEKFVCPPGCDQGKV